MIRILIVDDHPAFRAWARLVLVADGSFEVVGEAEDGAHALHEARRARPDAVLLDVQLPDRDGFDVARQLASGPDAPSIVMTSSRDAVSYGLDLERTGLPFVPKVELSPETVRAALGEVA